MKRGKVSEDDTYLGRKLGPPGKEANLTRCLHLEAKLRRYSCTQSFSLKHLLCLHSIHAHSQLLNIQQLSFVTFSSHRSTFINDNFDISVFNMELDIYIRTGTYSETGGELTEVLLLSDVL